MLHELYDDSNKIVVMHYMIQPVGHRHYFSFPFWCRRKDHVCFPSTLCTFLSFWSPCFLSQWNIHSIMVNTVQINFLLNTLQKELLTKALRWCLEEAVQKAIPFEGVIQILWQVYHMNSYIDNFVRVTKMQSYLELGG